MAEKRVEREIERQKPDIQEHIKGVKFHELAPGVTTHPLVRSGRPCIEGTGIMVTTIAGLQKYRNMDAQQIADHLRLELFMVQDALNYYASHIDYIETELQLDDINHEQLAESHYGDFSREILSRRESTARDT
ncbi:MAG: DUF433 domain-containing protein [Chloroflexota bacterium]|nr:DUF433 domain-containing protein [Chloroflexota bacterium]MDE2946508.1 DUF433 domain-containing protein [Chloroflexota bacterium]